MIKSILIFQFLFLFKILSSQDLAGNKYSNKCEFLFFENDSSVEFSVYGSIKGATATRYCGYGVYHLIDSNLIIKNIEAEVSLSNSSLNCDSCHLSTSSINKYIIRFLSEGVLHVTGPILHNYKKLNRKRQFSGILNWPWRWNFSKQHWYDPRETILSK